MMKVLLIALVISLSSWTSRADDTNKFNKLVDEVIWEMEQKMINESKTQVNIPDIDETFTKKVLFFTLDGSVKISGAYVKNLSTIHRVGDVIPVQSDDDTLSVSGTFAMKELSAHADLFDFHLSVVHVNDPLTLVIGSNSASFKVTLTFDENMNCKTTLNYAKISQLGDFKIDLGKTGVMVGIEDDLATYVLNKYSSTIQDTINSHLFPIVNDAIQKLDLCTKLL